MARSASARRLRPPMWVLLAGGMACVARRDCRIDHGAKHRLLDRRGPRRQATCRGWVRLCRCRPWRFSLRPFRAMDATTRNCLGLERIRPGRSLCRLGRAMGMGGRRHPAEERQQDAPKLTHALALARPGCRQLPFFLRNRAAHYLLGSISLYGM